MVAERLLEALVSGGQLPVCLLVLPCRESQVLFVVCRDEELEL